MERNIKTRQFLQSLLTFSSYNIFEIKPNLGNRLQISSCRDKVVVNVSSEYYNSGWTDIVHKGIYLIDLQNQTNTQITLPALKQPLTTLTFCAVYNNLLVFYFSSTIVIVSIEALGSFQELQCNGKIESFVKSQ